MARDFVKEHFWRRMVAGWRASGLTVREYCSRHKLAEGNFYAWRRELARREPVARSGSTLPKDRLAKRPGRGVRSSRPPLFVPLAVEGSLADTAVEVVLAGGQVLRVRPGCDRATLANVLAVLEDRPC